MSQEVKEKEQNTMNVKEEIISWIKTIVSAVIIAFLLSHFVISSVQVPTGSMLNTIQLGDRIIGNRLSYKFSDPERGDVVIFYAPDEEDTLYIKRLIGLPGDKVVIEDSKVYINDSETPLEEDYLPEEWVEGNDGMEFNVPEDCYFFMGDNRNWSLDARYWENTYVHRDKIVAKACFIYFPFSDAKFL